ncbi:uncharacterized protein LOC116308223 [Actinia tenebrosa]|uniref:Uncharacterized protein LOC116308223 n=1 Tax=Actinia tenebrosa TaxID=6105 RepID=A0A6P8J396_ACTTE|nr:uncharacterized protein LOC116308223 [Actinia tenebrosa]
MPSYWKTNFTKICLGMRRTNTGNVNWIKINMTAESLYSLLADGTEKTTALGRSAWESLFPDHKLQVYSCKEGLNIVGSDDIAKQEFTYTSQHWSEKTAYNEGAGQTGIDDLNETKMPSYWKTNFTKICLGMRSNTGNVNWIKIDMTAESLYSLLADGTEKETTALGRSAWVSLFPDHKLQNYYCKEGMNMVGNKNKAKVRIGIIADNSNDCNVPNSCIGVGVETGSYLVPCGSSNSRTEGSCTSNCFIFVQ